MNHYDSILKEEKKYQEVEPLIKNKKLAKYILIDFIVVLLVLIISYLYYYHNVITPQNIFFQNLNYLQKDFNSIIEPLNLSRFQDNYRLNGNIVLPKDEYSYEVIRDNHKLEIDITKDKRELTYFLNNNLSYTKIKDLFNNSYIVDDEVLYFNSYRLLQENIKNIITNEKFVKRFYLDDKKPVVEVNLVLNTNDLIQLFSLKELKEDMNITLIFKNDALTNQLLNVKCIINNKTKNTRVVLEYSDKSMVFTDNEGEKTLYNLETSNKDFTIKITKSDVLHSIITGTKKENSYQYSYQVIDKIYNLTLDITENNEKTNYLFHSNIENGNQKEETTVSIESNYKNDGALDEIGTSRTLKSDEKQTYQKEKENIVLPIRELIDKYKDSIQSVQKQEENS